MGKTYEEVRSTLGPYVTALEGMIHQTEKLLGPCSTPLEGPDGHEVLLLLEHMCDEILYTESTVRKLPLWSDPFQRPKWAQLPTVADRAARESAQGEAHGALVAKLPERMRQLVHLVDRHAAAMAKFNELKGCARVCGVMAAAT